MRTSRIRTTALAAAATAALAVSLTACGSSDDNGAGKTEVSTVGKATADKTTEKPGTSDGSDGSNGSDQAGPSRSASGSAAQGSGASGTTVEATRSTSVRQCDGTEMSYSVLHRFAKQRGEHLLITATNADAKPCWVASYPSVMLGKSANVLPHTSKDAPGGTDRITVKPGGKVYSAVNLFTGGGRSQTSADLSLALRDRTGDTGPGTDQQAFDAKGAPSKFTWSSADVTNWNTAKPYDF
ncbi:DUF4232 domain-containing protein [Streptomyces spectabilis]|uniref:DUF4232 domain-containing protein n=1 Tax=Streptomyces spectabilis TaxID=68270 RepID=UPI0033EEED53